MLLRFACLLIPTLTWAAPITYLYGVSIGPVDRDGVVLDAWSYTFMLSGELPHNAVNFPITMNGTPHADAVVSLTRVGNAFDPINESVLQVRFTSADLGWISYELRQDHEWFDSVGTFPFRGKADTALMDGFFDGVLVISQIPEPGTWMTFLSGLALAVYRKSRAR